jgi:hypothetical protein
MNHLPLPDDPAILRELGSPVLLHGDSRTAYRDPAVIFHHDYFHLFFTHVEIDDGVPFLTVGMKKSSNLAEWSPLVQLTQRDVRLNFSSPGDIVWDGQHWMMCLQSYPRPNGERYANEDARLYAMYSDDLENWTSPELLKVKGPDIPVRAMGRMIDPCLFRDRTNGSGWWCVYKQNGLSFSWSDDLRMWRHIRTVRGGENPCVISERDSYIMIDSPSNGLEICYSENLEKWTKRAKTTLGQREWTWAQGRLTAGFLLDLRNNANVRRALLFFHGSAFREGDPRGGFDNYASIGCAWSDNLIDWRWPVTCRA